MLKNRRRKIEKFLWIIMIFLVGYLVIKALGLLYNKDVRAYILSQTITKAEQIVTKAVIDEVVICSDDIYMGKLVKSDELKIADYDYSEFLSESFATSYASVDSSEYDIAGFDTLASSEFEKNFEEKSVEEVASASKTLSSNQAIINKLMGAKDYKFLVNNFYIVDSTTSVNNSLINPNKLLNMDVSIKKNSEKPQILIYHTHSTESYCDSRDGVQDDTIVGVGGLLEKILEEEYGYNVIHDKTSYDVVNGVWNRLSYDTALPSIQKVLKDNPSIEVSIDMHRDSGSKKEVTTIDGNKTARVMFFNGVSRSSYGERANIHNNNLEQNLAFSLKNQIKAMEIYPDFVKKIYLKGYRYNLHILPNAALIEVGNDKNTVSEAKNAMYPLAKVLSEVLEGKQ